PSHDAPLMPARELFCLQGHKGCVVALAFGPDRTTLASAAGDETVRVWDFSHRGPHELAVLPLPREEVSALVFLGRRRLAAGTNRGSVWLWDLTDAAPDVRG